MLQGDLMHHRFSKKILYCILLLIFQPQNASSEDGKLGILREETLTSENQIQNETVPEVYTLPHEEALEKQAEVLKQLEYVKIALQHIAHLVQARAFKHAQPFALLQWTQSLMQQINEYQKWLQSQQPSVTILGTSLLTNKLLIEYVLNAIRTKFALLQEFSLENTVKRSTLLEINPEALEKYFVDNHRLLRTLDRTTKKMGISYVNKFFRSIDHLIKLPIIQPALKLSFIGLSGYALYKGLDFGLAKIDAFINSYFIPQNYAQKSGLHDAIIVEPFHFVPDALKQSFGHAIGTIAVTAAGKIAAPAWEPFAQGFQKTYDTATALWSSLKGDVKDASLQQQGLIIEDITLDHPNLVGLDYQKQQLMDNIVRPLMQPELFLHTGMELERAVALIGPSRNGKTLIAKALCGTINARFKAAGRFDRMGFREIPHWTLKKYPLKAIIEDAQANGPMVLFIDEYHLLRPNAGGQGREQELVEQLTELETLYKTNDPSKMVFLVIATNRPDMLATELFSHKRFGLVIRFEKPNHEQRKMFFTERSQQLAITLTPKDIATFVAQTHNRSYGDLDQIFQDAKVLAKQKGESLQAHHIQEKINSKIHNIKSSMTLPEQERRVAAAHYAGHVVAHYILGLPDSIELVTINAIDRSIKERNENGFVVDEQGTLQNPNNAQVYIPRFGKMVTYNVHEAVSLHTVQETLHKAQVKLAGALAEEILLGSRSISYHPKDRQKALNLIKTTLLQGLTEKQLPEKQKQDLMEKALQQLAALEQEIREKLLAHKNTLLRLYHTLYDRQTLEAAELAHSINQTL